MLFSGSLCCLLGVSLSLVWITPIGGTSFLIGWALLSYSCLKRFNNKDFFMKKTTQFQNLSSLQKNLLAQLAHMMIVDSRRLSAKIKGD